MREESLCIASLIRFLCLPLVCLSFFFLFCGFFTCFCNFCLLLEKSFCIFAISTMGRVFTAVISMVSLSMTVKSTVEKLRSVPINSSPAGLFSFMLKERDTIRSVIKTSDSLFLLYSANFLFFVLIWMYSYLPGRIVILILSPTIFTSSESSLIDSFLTSGNAFPLMFFLNERSMAMDDLVYYF